MTLFFRRLPPFDYLKPEGIEEALAFMQGNPVGTFRVYAGGTDVLPKIKRRTDPVPQTLIDLKGVMGLDYVTAEKDGGLRIGALASINAVAESEAVKSRFPMLHQAAFSIASHQIRNRGTIVGNLCNAVPSADSAPALLCLEARVLCAGPRGERVVELNRFFTGPGKTVLEPDELVKEIHVPPAEGRGVYIKLSPRSRMDLAVVGVAALAETRDAAFSKVRVGLGAVAPAPIRAGRCETFLEGRPVSDEVIAEAAKIAADESRPIDDHRASAEYRRLMVEVLVKRALRQVSSSQG
ncbi:FAD binding domain-containing protein [Desulfatiglans anilini]|uniref:FAD binding domain-containing protein n=1 Tax=Desulfatiglans anilini TaxID=90728 RepID=UPI0004260647|nr:FAD binding domain-containing protein [Desulfatiglans anilini]